MTQEVYNKAYEILFDMEKINRNKQPHLGRLKKQIEEDEFLSEVAKTSILREISCEKDTNSAWVSHLLKEFDSL